VEIGKSVIAPGINAGAQGDTRFHKNETNNGEIRPSNVADDGGEIYFNHPTLGKTVIPPNEITTPWEGGGQPYGNRFYLVWSQTGRTTRGLDGSGGQLFTLEYNDETETWTAWGNTNNAPFTPAPTDVVLAIGEKDAGATTITALRSLVGNEVPVIQRVDTLENSIGSDTDTDTSIWGEINNTKSIVFGPDGNSGLVQTVSSLDNTLNTPETGLLARVTETESALTDISDPNSLVSIAGRVSTTEAGLTGGGNLAPNSRFIDSKGQNDYPRGWDLVWDEAGTDRVDVGVNIHAGAEWYLDGEDGTLVMRDLGGPVTGEGRFDIRITDLFPVEAGKRYVWSIYAGPHRCSVRVLIRWIDASNVTLGYSIGTNYSGPNNGGDELSDYERIFTVGEAPAGAVRAEARVRKSETDAGEPNSFVFAVRPQFEEVSAGQNHPSPWSEGSDGANSIARTSILEESLFSGSESRARLMFLAESNGRISSGWLTSTTNPSGQTTTGIGFDADVFAIWNGTSETAPFQVVGGNVYLKNDLIVDGAITTSKLAAGAVTADEIAANAITASKIAVVNSGQNMFLDRYVKDAEYWGLYEVNQVTDSVAEVAAMGVESAVEVDLSTMSAVYPNVSKTFDVESGKAYRASMKVAGTANANRDVFIQFNFMNKDGTVIQYASGGHTYSQNFTNPVTEIINEKVAPAGAVRCTLGFYVNNNTTEQANHGPGVGKIWFTDFFVAERIDAELIVDGSITTSKLLAGSVITEKLAANAITGDKVSANAITGEKINAATAINVGTGASLGNGLFDRAGMWGQGSTSNPIRFFAGHTSPTQAPYQVDQEGAIRARRLTILTEDGGAVWFDTQTGFSELARAQILAQSSPRTDTLAETKATNTGEVSFSLVDTVNVTALVSVEATGLSVTQEWAYGDPEPSDVFPNSLSINIETQPDGGAWTDRVTTTYTKTTGSPSGSQYQVEVTTQAPSQVTFIDDGVQPPQQVTYDVPGWKTERIVSPTSLSATTTNSFTGDADGESYNVRAVLSASGGTPSLLGFDTKTRTIQLTTPSKDFVLDLSTVQGEGNANTLDGIDSSGFWRKSELTSPIDADANGRLDLRTLTTTNDTQTNGVFSMPYDSYIYLSNGSYLRKLIGYESAGKDIEIGQGGTSIIGGINLLPGSSGQAKVNGNQIIDASGGSIPTGTLSFGSTTRQMLNLWNATYGIGIQSNTLYHRAQANFAWYTGGSHSNTALSGGTGGTRAMHYTGGSFFVHDKEVLTLQSGAITGSGSTSLGNPALLHLKNTTVSNSAYATIRLENGNGDLVHFGMNAPGQASYGGDQSIVLGSFESGEHRKFAFVSANATRVLWDGAAQTYDFTGTLKQSGQNVATQSWVTSQGYLTSVGSLDASAITTGVFNILRTAPSLVSADLAGTHAVGEPTNGVTVWMTSTDANYPFQYAAIASFRKDVNRQFQLAMGNNSDLYARRGHSSGWEGWRKIWHDGNFTPTSQPASNITSGTFATARIPTTQGATGNTIPIRNASGDIYARLFRSTYANQTGISGSATVAMRVNNGGDNYIRHVTGSGFFSWFNSQAQEVSRDRLPALLGNGRMMTFRSTAGATMSGTTNGSIAALEVEQTTSGADALMLFHVNGDYAAYFGLSGASNDLVYGGYSAGGTPRRVYHQGNRSILEGEISLNASRITAGTLNSARIPSLPYVSNGGGNYSGYMSWSSYVEAGRGSGGVAMTVNDGYGNANLTFNHRNGVPDGTGSACRIECPVDGTTGAMIFEVGDNVTAGTAVSLPTVMTLGSTYASIIKRTHIADFGGDDLKLTVGRYATDFPYLGVQFAGGNSRLETSAAWGKEWRITGSGLFRFSSSLSRVEFDSLAQFDNSITLPTGSGTVAGSNFSGGWIRIGSSSLGWAIDNNEFYGFGNVNFGAAPGGKVNVHGDVEFKQITRIATGTGYVDIGSNNSSYCHFTTDRGQFYFNKQIDASGGFEVYNSGGTRLDSAGLNLAPGDILNHNNTQSRDKIRVWNNGNYAIGMEGGYTLGSLNDYAMTFQMNNDSDRGFWWGYAGQAKSAGAMSLTTNGRLYVTTSITCGGNVTQNSDRSLKHSIRPWATDFGALIDQIELKRFGWKDEQKAQDDYGVIAQEIEKVLPEVVQTQTNGTLSVDYSKVALIAVGALKQERKRNDELEARLERLEALV
jgi:hypothetical protein